MVDDWPPSTPGWSGLQRVQANLTDDDAEWQPFAHLSDEELLAAIADLDAGRNPIVRRNPALGLGPPSPFAHLSDEELLAALTEAFVPRPEARGRGLPPPCSAAAHHPTQPEPSIGDLTPNERRPP